MKQGRLDHLAILAIYNELERAHAFDEIIQYFAVQKARKFAR